MTCIASTAAFNALSSLKDQLIQDLLI